MMRLVTSLCWSKVDYKNTPSRVIISCYNFRTWLPLTTRKYPAIIGLSLGYHCRPSVALSRAKQILDSDCILLFSPMMSYKTMQRGWSTRDVQRNITADIRVFSNATLRCNIIRSKLQHRWLYTQHKEFHTITACMTTQGSVKDAFLSKGKPLIFDGSPDPNPATDRRQNLA